MTYLVYCVMKGYRGPARPSPGGMRGPTVWVLHCGDLCAALSAEAPSVTAAHDPPATGRLDDLLTYAKVVEAFNREETVVPMRFGCRFPGVAQVRSWMQSNAAHLRALLLRVDGCVEMGVRAMLHTAPPACQVRAAVPAAALGPGAAYLAARRVELALAQRCECVARQLREALRGRFRECIAEIRSIRSLGQDAMASLHFLVERGGLCAFAHAFGSVGSSEAALMLTGPWPPYNFVCGGDELAGRIGL